MRISTPLLLACLAITLLPPAATAESRHSPDPEDPLPRLVRALARGDLDTRLNAAAELARHDDLRAVTALASAALSDEAPPVRAEAILGLGEIGFDVGVRFFHRVLLDPDPGVRGAAVDAAAEIGGAVAVRALAFALTDEEPLIREQAVYALGDLGGEAALGFLQRALSDKNESVRVAAGDVLEETGRRR